MDDKTIRKDLDETRRLLYGALVARKTKRWELVGTLTNALVHHSGLATDPTVVSDMARELVDGNGSAEDWARDLIAQITERLESEVDAAALDVPDDDGHQQPHHDEAD
jgi:hypothetical protein